MSHNKDYTDITKYLLGEMSAEEKEKFEERLEKDPELKQSLSLNKDIDVAIRNEEAIEFIDLVKQDLDKRRSTQFPSWWKTNKGFYGIAAIITLLITIGFLLIYFTSGNNQDRKELLALFRPAKIDHTFRSEDSHEQIEIQLGEGISLFNSNNYKNAAIVFKEVSQDAPESIQLKYYYGLSMIYSGQIDAGKQIMNQVVDSEDLLYSKEALWQSVYCCIMQDSLGMAKAGLIELKQDPYYKEKVNEVLAFIDGN